MSIPLSLETCCFLKLIGHLETFPCDSLALLPLRLRYVLIQNLPAADVCRLEQSRFVEGMDMEHVWATLIKENVLPKFPHSKDECTKEAYFSNLCHTIVTWRSYTMDSEVVRFLFSVQQCLGIEDLSMFAHPFHQEAGPLYRQNFITPPRYLGYFTSAHSNVDCVRIVLDASCYYYPKSLIVNCDSFWENLFSQKWLFPENLKMLMTYLHQIRHLFLNFCNYSPSKASVLSVVTPFILSILSNNGLLQLKDFYVRDFMGRFIETTVFAISPYLKGGEGTCNCNTLETISLFAYLGCPEATYQLSETAALELVDIIDNQIELRKVELCTYSCTGLSCMLLSSALANLFQQPQFRELHLGLSGMNAGSFQELLYSYLTTPRSEDLSLHLQKMHVTKDMSTFSHNLLCLNIPHENILHKTLELSSLQLPDAAFVWIQEHVCLRLKELKVTLPSCALMTLLLNHPRLEIESFALTGKTTECVELLHSPQCFDNILGSVHLRCFRLQLGLDRYAPYRNKDLGGVLVTLVSGLHRQAQIGKLEVLYISYTRWDLLAEAELSLLFEAIFSLPQLEDFTLDIGYCNFTEQHIKLLCKSWKEIAGGKQLKELRVVHLLRSRVSGINETAFTEKIAKDIVTTKK